MENSTGNQNIPKKQRQRKPSSFIKEVSGTDNRYRNLFESVKDGILILDLETETIIDANPSFTELTGFPIRSLLGKKPGELNLFPDMEFKTVCNEIKNEGYSFRENLSIRKKDGEIKEMEFVSNTYQENGNKVILCNIRDIEKRKQKQEALRISETRFRQISESTRELIWEVDLNGLYTYVNSITKDILGYEPNELIGKKHFFDFFESEKKEVLKKQIFEIFARKKSIKNFISCNIHKDGHKICFSTNGFPILDLENNLIGYRGVNIDVTAQLETGEALRRSEAKTKTILEAISTGIMIVDPKTHTIMDVNAEAVRLFGESKDKIIGKVCHKFICPAEEDKCPVTQFGKKIDNSERILINSKGQHIPILKTVTLIDVGGQKLLLENFTDITKQKKADDSLRWEKDRYKAIINAIPDLIFRLDGQGRFLDYKADEKDLAVQTGDIIGKLNRDIMPPEFADLVEEKIQATLKTGETQTFEYKLLVPGKGIRNYNARMVVSGENEVIAFVRDITEQKQTEIEIEKSERRYRDLFENAATPIWELDLSETIDYLEKIKEKGVTDFQKYFDESPKEVLRAVAKAKLTDANKEIISFLKAKDKQQATSKLFNFLVEDSVDTAKEVIKNLANGQSKLEGEIPMRTATGEIKHVLFRISVPPSGQDAMTKSLASFIDITDRVKAEKALKESEKRLHQIMENVDSVFYMISYKTGKLVYINSTYEKIWGQSAKDIMEDPLKWIDAIHIDDRYLAMNLFEHGEGEVQYRIVSPDGSIKWIWDKMFPILNNKGDIEFLCGMASDITESKQAEQILRESEAKLEEATKIAKLATWEFDIEHKEFRFNDQIYELLKTTAEQEGGYCISGDDYLNKFLYPEDAQFLVSEATKAIKSKDTDYNTHIDHRIKYLGGGEGYLAINLRTEKDPSGWTTKLYGIVQDITERKRAEESLKLFRRLIDNSNDAIEVIDIKTGRYLDVNKKACSDLGYTREEMLNMRVFDIDPNQNPEVFKQVIEEFSKSNSSNLIETTHVRKDGSVFPVEVNVTIIELEKTYAIAVARDITERKLAEKELADSEARYRLLFQTTAEGIIMVDPETLEIKLANKAICNMFGYTEEEMLQLKITNLHPREILDFIVSDFESHAQGKKTFSEDIPCLKKDGTIFYANIYDAIISIDGKNYNIGFLTDITAQKEAVSKIKLFRTLIDHSNDAIELIDLRSGRFVDCNEKAYKELGYTREEFLLLKPTDADMMLTEEDYNELVKSIRIKETMLVEGTAKRKDGSEFPTEVSLNYVKLEQEFIVAIVRNITERKIAEEALKERENSYRTLAENLPAAVYRLYLREQGKMEFFNNVIEQITGYTKDELRKGDVCSIDPFISSKDKPYVVKAVTNAIRNNSEFEVEYRLKRKDGHVSYFYEKGKSIVGEDGKPLYIDGVIFDITENKRAEKELIDAKNRAEESDRLKSAFLANMSHEIRTPMNGILGFTELLKEPRLSGEEKRKYIDIIEKSGTRMLNIINDIISISKIEAGQVEISNADTNINDQLVYIHAFFKKEAEQKNLNFILKDLLPKEEAVVRTDREKIYAVMINLVKNALKFTSEGSIEFGCIKKDGFLEFFVKDTGTGIGENKREVIFERFIQGSEALNRDYEGAGLGLAISKGYIEMLGGKIWVTQNLLKDPVSGASYEKGSVFYFTIPVHQSGKPGSEDSDASNYEISGIKNNKLKVLIAEDDEVSLMLIRKMMIHFSREIITAINGKEAVEACRNNPDLDLILMDMKMPVLDGYEATEAIRAFNKNVIIIAQTAYGMIGDREKALRAGCNNYITKPINRTDLYEMIDKLFE